MNLPRNLISCTTDCEIPRETNFPIYLFCVLLTDSRDGITFFFSPIIFLSLFLCWFKYVVLLRSSRDCLKFKMNYYFLLRIGAHSIADLLASNEDSAFASTL